MSTTKTLQTLRLADAARELVPSLDAEQLIDRLGEAECRFLRFRGPADHLLPGVSRIRACPAGGWLLEGKENFWVPRLPMARRLDSQGHVLEETAAPLSGLALDDSGLTLSLAPPEDFVTDLIIWRLTPRLHQELTDLTPIETQAYFLWGSHTQYRKPADLYLHLIHGFVYENRASWPKYWKICSENDAHALYVLFSGLERATGKTLYRLFKRQLILSVLSRQAEDGGFYHGEWTDAMESHFRLHTSALHLLLDAYEEKLDASIATALERGVEFLLRHAERLESGLWFLHDSLELTAESMRQSPFQWLPCRAFGKSASNMLVLNTHLDTTVAVDRGARQLEKSAWQKAVNEANRTTETILAATPATWLYRLVFGPIALSFLPSERAAALPIWQRALKRLGWKYLIPYFHHLKCRFPRLVMPGGYLDRALCLKGISTAYQAINVMDLVRLQARFPQLKLRPYIDDAVAFTYRSGLWQRWAEDERTRYAYGFWAEALHRLCLLDPDPALRSRLAGTMAKLEELGLGQPPGLLGGDWERGIAGSPQRDLHKLLPGVRIADLSTPAGAEYLLLGTGKGPVRLDTGALGTGLNWTDPEGRPMGPELSLQPGQWAVGR
ncbi:hypothetical protein JCM13664_03040 [Methylothermus subterraneus]